MAFSDHDSKAWIAHFVMFIHLTQSLWDVYIWDNKKSYGQSAP